jgi:hypothetical protein
MSISASFLRRQESSPARRGANKTIILAMPITGFQACDCSEVAIGFDQRERSLLHEHWS